MTSALIGTALGLVLGIGASHALFFQGWTLLPWGAGGFALGYWLKSGRMVAGAAYGFVLCVSFLVAGYQGTASLLSRSAFFLVFGLLGAVCGLLLALVAGRLRAALGHHSRAGSSDPGRA